MKQLLALTLLTLAACSQRDRDTAEQPTAPASSAGEINAQPVVATSGPAQLTPLAVPASEKGDCVFLYQGRPLLALAASGTGRAIVDGTEIELKATNEGRSAFAGGAYRGAIEKSGSDDAALVLVGPGGETRFSPGKWSCAA